MNSQKLCFLLISGYNPPISKPSINLKEDGQELALKLYMPVVLWFVPLCFPTPQISNSALGYKGHLPGTNFSQVSALRLNVQMKLELH